MNFKEAIKKLRIEKYEERIFNSNSHGELFHLQQYITLAKSINIEDETWFAKWFECIVKEAEENWERPESIFQHISQIFVEQLTTHLENR